MYVIAAALLLLEILGYITAVSACARIQNAFVPAVVTASMTLLVFLGGIVGCLDGVVLIVHLAGILLFICAIVLKRFRNALHDVIKDPGIIFFYVGAIVVFLLLSNSMHGHYDEFSHWGTIVKDMFNSHGFPADGSIVSRVGYFVNYPPATASFIYWADSLLGYTEGHAIVAQNILLLSALSALFGAIRRPAYGSEVVLCALVALASLFVIESDLALFQTLLTDVVMGALVVAAVLLVVFNRQNLFRAVLLATPVITVASFVKDNGKLYLALFLLVVLVFAFAQRKNTVAQLGEKKAIASALLCLVIPCAVFLVLNTLWSAHVNEAFAAGFNSGKFAVSADKLLGGPIEDIAVIAQRVIYEAFFFKPSRSVIFWGLNIMAIGIILVGKKHGAVRSDLMCLTLIGNGAIFVTCLALVVLYSFFMPAGESKSELAGFTRYYGTSLLIFFCLVCRGIISWIYYRPAIDGVARTEGVFAATGRKRMLASAGIGLLVVALAAPGFHAFASGRGLMQLAESSIASEPVYPKLREPISSVLDTEENPIPPDASVSIYYGSDVAGSFAYFVSLYESRDTVYMLDATVAPEVARSDLEKSDWLIFIGADENEFFSYIKDLGVDLSGEGDTRYFSVRHGGDGKIRIAPVMGGVDDIWTL